jgi:hypothetical protein
VYFEGADVSFNFPENRDRCVLTRAPESPTTHVKSLDDLSRPSIRTLRPHHRIEIDPASDRISQASSWADASRTSYEYFLARGTFKGGDGDSDDEGASGGRPAADASTAAPTRGAEAGGARQRSLWAFDEWDDNDADALGHEDEDDHRVPDVVAEGGTADSMWHAIARRHEQQQAYRVIVSGIMGGVDPCIVLLVSPPGGGKSYYAKFELTVEMETKLGLHRVIIDGSNDELVDTSLRTILDRRVPSEACFLVVDEFHMLDRHHKNELFAWLKVHPIHHVLLIANRRDNTDDTLMKTFRIAANFSPARVRTVVTRLDTPLVRTVVTKRGITCVKQVLIWVHAARCVFGGEAISLRNLSEIAAAYQATDAPEDNGMAGGGDPAGEGPDAAAARAGGAGPGPRGAGRTVRRGDDSARARKLEKLLMAKLPRIAAVTARGFVRAFIEVATRVEEADRGVLDPGQDPLVEACDAIKNSRPRCSRSTSTPATAPTRPRRRGPATTGSTFPTLSSAPSARRATCARVQGWLRGAR